MSYTTYDSQTQWTIFFFLNQWHKKHTKSMQATLHSVIENAQLHYLDDRVFIL